MATNEIIVSRISDNTASSFKAFIEGKCNGDEMLQLQGFKCDFVVSGITSCVKAENLKNAYYITYESALSGVKISMLKNYSKIDFAKFVDNEINTFTAMLDTMPVVVKRIEGKAYIYANVNLLVYYA